MKRVQRLLGVSMPVASGLRTGLLAAAILSLIGASALWGFSEDSQTRQERQWITIREGESSLNVQMWGEVKLDKNSKDGVALGEGAVLEISAKDGVTTRHITVRREGGEIKKTYRENGSEKPMNAEAEAWMDSQIQEIGAVEIHKSGMAVAGNKKISFEIREDGKDGSGPRIIAYSNKDAAGRVMFNGEPFNLRLEYPSTSFFDGDTFPGKDIDKEVEKMREDLGELLAELQTNDELLARLQTNSGGNTSFSKDLEKELEIMQGQFEEALASLQTNSETLPKQVEESRAKAQADTETAQKWIKEASAHAETLRKQVEELRAKELALATEARTGALANREAVRKYVEETARAHAETQKWLEEAQAKSRTDLEARLKRMEEDYARAKKEGALDTKELEAMEQDLKGVRNIHEYDAKVRANYEKYRAKMKANPGSAQKWSEEYFAKARADAEEFRTKSQVNAEEARAKAQASREAAQKRVEAARARAKEAKSRSEAFQKSLDEAIAKAKAEGRKMTQEDLENSLREQGIFESVYISDAPVVHVMTADGEQWREMGRQIFASSKANSEAIKKAVEEARAKAKAEGRAMDIKELEKRLKEMGLSSDAAILVDRDKNNLMPDNATFYLLY